MTTEQIFSMGAALFVVGLLTAIVVVIASNIFKSSTSAKLASQYGYKFWKGYPGLTKRYPESRLFYSKLYVNACFINENGIEVGVTSLHQAYMTMPVGAQDSESLYIDGTKDNRLGAGGRAFGEDMFDTVDGKLRHVQLEKVTLEGDFYRHFNVLQPVGAQIETLSLLTPDVMAKLIDLYGDCNIEINKGRLTVFMAPSGQSRSHSLDISFVQEQFRKAGLLRALLTTVDSQAATTPSEYPTV